MAAALAAASFPEMLVQPFIKNITCPAEVYIPQRARMPRPVPSFPFRRSATRPRSRSQSLGLLRLRPAAGTPRKKRVCALDRGVEHRVCDGGMRC